MRFLLLALCVFLTSEGFAAGSSATSAPRLQSRYALVLDEDGKELVSKNPDSVTSIASVTKVMTAMVALDAKPDLDEILTITGEDKDTLKHSFSRMPIGSQLSRRVMLKLALSSSENRAAHALSRYYPGGEQAFIQAMNQKAAALGMTHSRFRDPTGLNPGNISCARDLAIMVQAAMQYPLIREASTTKQMQVRPMAKRKPMQYKVTNRFLRNNSPNWTIYLSKTGYTEEAGRCLVMQAKTAGRTMTIVLLDASGKLTPYGDSDRIRKWLTKSSRRVASAH
ncbi:MAG: serine hydrolase [Gammaproteobacteria bacterium]|nr:serine hydrolase [Gammaproteobacteria bacterium]MBU1653971.1 serine hydrolase [Gammaproteobacteria bacterium]MBU1960477.1 serine hydrolase [Gammaproteobacteria bacterium]